MQRTVHSFGAFLDQFPFLTHLNLTGFFSPGLTSKGAFRSEEWDPRTYYHNSPIDRALHYPFLQAFLFYLRSTIVLEMRWDSGMFGYCGRWTRRDRPEEFEMDLWWHREAGKMYYT
ncbi:hypothetical protein JCM11641_001924 [Rhodosporidiobolus odoratus]